MYRSGAEIRSPRTLQIKKRNFWLKIRLRCRHSIEISKLLVWMRTDFLSFKLIKIKVGLLRLLFEHWWLNDQQGASFLYRLTFKKWISSMFSQLKKHQTLNTCNTIYRNFNGNRALKREARVPRSSGIGHSTRLL